MKQALYGQNIKPACTYCKFGVKSSDEKTVLCSRKGIMEQTASCRKFTYDPLLRVPTPQPQLKTFNEKEFAL